MAETTAASVPAPPERSLKRRLVRIIVWLVIVAAIGGVSISQQLVTTAVNMGYALVLVILIFGWTGGKLLVSSSYVDAKVKAKDMKDSRGKNKRTDEDDTGEDLSTNGDGE